MKKDLNALMLGATLSLLGSLALHAADTETRPFPGVHYAHRQVSTPREIDMHIVLVDPNRPGVTIKTTGPNGDRPGETDLETTRAFVRRSRAQIGINSGFFNRTANERRLGVADLSSLAVSDGDTTYQQTAIGHTADHRLILFVSDGRQPEFSAGMTYGEVAAVLKEFGAVDAIALDGGGSATIFMADGKGGEPRVLNRPSDGQERAVGNNLSVIIRDIAGPTTGPANKGKTPGTGTKTDDVR